MGTITSTINSGITLANSGSYTSPLTVTSTGYVDNTGTGDAIFGPSTKAWTVVNQGRITGGVSGVGVDLKKGGLVTNSGGTIKGPEVGVWIAGAAGSVNNTGTIIGTATVSLGVYLAAGGTVTNSAGGLIEGASVVYIKGGTDGTLINAGTIVGTAYFGGVFGGKTYPGAAVYIKSSKAFVDNSGIIVQSADTSNFGIELHLGGTVVNESGGLIEGLTAIKTGSSTGNTGTVINAGTLFGTAGKYWAVNLLYGGYVNNTGGLIEGPIAVYVNHGAGKVTNAAAIVGTTTYGIQFVNGGTVTNNGGSIVGPTALYIAGKGGTVTNAALIRGTTKDGVDLGAGGSIANNGGYIEGATAVKIGGSAGTVTNSGTLLGTGGQGIGVYFAAGGAVKSTGGLIEGALGVYIRGGVGTVTNAGTIVGSSTYGIELVAGGTVTDSGFISGAGGTAIWFAGGKANLLELGHGYKITGKIVGSGTGADTVVLAGSLGASLTVGYDALSLTSFETLLFGPGGYDRLDISDKGSLPITISGFGSIGDLIDLTALGTDAVVSHNDAITHQVTFSGSGGSLILQMDANDSSSLTTQSDSLGGIFVVCFRRGTSILTDTGEVLVENLKIGDLAVTLGGELRPIRWIGRRAYDGRFIAGNRDALPICIRAGALADNTPQRDLWVSPEHSLYINGLLVRARCLLNGTTITQANSVGSVEYFHIELDTHDIIFAEGAPAESYVDCDNREIFANAAQYSNLYPADARPRWVFCAERLAWGSDDLTAIRAWLLHRATALGYALEQDPGLHLIVDGKILWPIGAAGDSHHFSIPAGSAAIWVASRCVIPAESDANSTDIRRLGVPIDRFVLRGADLSIEISHSHFSLSDGFHADEASHRWTDGCARLPDALLRPFSDAFTLEVYLAANELLYPPSLPLLAAA